MTTAVDNPPPTLAGRMLAAITHASQARPADDDPRIEQLRQAAPNRPRAVRQAIAALLPAGYQTILTGSLERRLLAINLPDAGRWWLADLSGQPHASRAWPTWAAREITVHGPDRWLATATLTSAAIRRLTRPRVLLVGLYRPEIFPLPRFALSLADLARAARTHLTGQVDLLDMQLGATLDHVTAAIAGGDPCDAPPDIVGISATFGQHDLLEAVITTATKRRDPPLVVAGGSLTARNETLLLAAHPRLLVARTAGETTITDLLDHWHGELDLPAVRGIGLAACPGPPRQRGIPRTAARPWPLPELDLLDAALAAGGVAQLETSRGCTSACSFCPRGHKGSWVGADPDDLPWLLQQMRAVFDRHPATARVLYLVDEEFIGDGPDPVGRARAIAETLHDAGFAWETSCRIDQVRRPDAGRGWNHDRAILWRDLVDHGLRRCLFGVESGVDSVLERFAKHTTAEQNALAARTLSALGVPTRFTYITFDPLMSIDELRATHAWQGRTDLLLRPVQHVYPGQIVDAVTNEDFVARHSSGRPFYTQIPYMLVCMECLTGSAYTHRVRSAGLAGTSRPAMGRVDTGYTDWRIGVAAHHAQMWIDRNFTLDYTLKSLEKILDGPARHHVRDARTVIKDAAYALLGDMLHAIDAHVIDQPQDRDRLARRIREAMTIRHTALRTTMNAVLAEVSDQLPPASALILISEHDRWRQATTWRLINAPATESDAPRPRRR